MKKIIF